MILTALIAIIVSIVTDKPQKICENGILIRFSLIKWSDIKKVKFAEAAEDEILIILKPLFAITIKSDYPVCRMILIQ